MARVSALPISVHLVLSEASEVVEHHPGVETLAQWTRISCFALRLIQPGQQQINILLLQNLFCATLKVGDCLVEITCVFWASSYNGERDRVLRPNIVQNFPQARKIFSDTNLLGEKMQYVDLIDSWRSSTENIGFATNWKERQIHLEFIKLTSRSLILAWNTKSTSTKMILCKKLCVTFTETAPCPPF